jgi:hypothetical protein
VGEWLVRALIRPKMLSKRIETPKRNQVVMGQVPHKCEGGGWKDLCYIMGWRAKNI